MWICGLSVQISQNNRKQAQNRQKGGMPPFIPENLQIKFINFIFGSIYKTNKQFITDTPANPTLLFAIRLILTFTGFITRAAEADSFGPVF
jgi:hypothetical protein